MPVRFLAGIAAGLLVGCVLFEGLLAGLDLLTPGLDVRASLVAGHGLTRAAALSVALFLLLAAASSASMATACAGLSLSGWLAGLLWMVPALVLAGLGGLSDPLITLAACACLIGTVAGTSLGRAASAH